jgi:hypothetical protein
MEATLLAESILALLALIEAIFGVESTLLQSIVAAFATLAVVVGVASTIVAALEKIADITPTDKDNIAIGKLRRWLAWLVAVLDRLALNPDEKRARKGKDDGGNS